MTVSSRAVSLRSILLRAAIASLVLAVWLAPSSVRAFAFQASTTQIPMRDGRYLSADVYLPSTGGPWPVIVIQTPYNKNLFSAQFANDYFEDTLLKNPNYGWVVVDWRGFFGSSSAQFSGCPTRGQDGYDVVEWIANQSWSNRKVGAGVDSALGTQSMVTA